MTNIPDLFEYRVGIEATDAWGTAVAQTFKLMDVSELSLTPIVTGTQIKDRRGSLAPGFASVLSEVRGEASLTGWLSVQQSMYWFNSLLQDVDPSTDADGNTWNWVAPSSDGAPAINSFTIAKGVASDADSIKSLRGATVNSLNISGAVNEPTSLTVGFIGAAVDTDTFDAGAAANVETQVFNSCGVELWIDPDSDAVGTTAISATGFDFNFDYNANRKTYGHLGDCVHDGYAEGRHEGALTMGFELNATSAAYLDGILTADTNGLIKKVIRLKMTSDTNHLQIDFNGIALEAPQLYSDRDGVSTLDITFNGQYGSTLGNWLKVEAQNAIEAF